MNKLKVYAIWCGTALEKSRCVFVTEQGSRVMSDLTAESELEARTLMESVSLYLAAAARNFNTPLGPNPDEDFEATPQYDTYDLEFVGEADRSRYPELVAMLGLS